MLGLSAHILVPWFAGDLQRSCHFRILMDVLARQAKAVFGHHYKIHLHVNGDHCTATLAALMGQLWPGFPIMTSVTRLADKSAAVSFGAKVAVDSRADVLIVVDNDVMIPHGGLESLVAAFRRASTGAACGMKAPLTDGSSSPFQLLYSYAVQQSFQHDLFPKRGTGSFYAIDPAVADLVMSNTRAGDRDILAEIDGSSGNGVLVGP